MFLPQLVLVSAFSSRTWLGSSTVLRKDKGPRLQNRNHLNEAMHSKSDYQRLCEQGDKRSDQARLGLTREPHQRTEKLLETAAFLCRLNWLTSSHKQTTTIAYHEIRL
jgi:hypothetical protein